MVQHRYPYTVATVQLNKATRLKTLAHVFQPGVNPRELLAADIDMLKNGVAWRELQVFQRRSLHIRKR